WLTSIASIITSSGELIRLNYIQCLSPSLPNKKGTIILIHGFPQTSYQFRHVITPLSDAGYTVVAPDYRGASQSSKPLAGYAKFQMAEDLKLLLHSHLELKEKVHIVGHDIGGMVAFAYAAQYPENVATLTWSEFQVLHFTSCWPSQQQMKGTPDVFRFVFHQIRDLPESLVMGKEREYLKYFFDKLAYNIIGPIDLDRYVVAYTQPGAMRAGFEVYRAFEQDAEDNRKWLAENGKVRVPVLGMGGRKHLIAQHMEGMMAEVHDSTDALFVEGSGHFIAEKDPESFMKGILEFVSEYNPS
ncbi:alpha/beta-hydrolase, partial [Corynespora cassiicola Philippines]